MNNELQKLIIAYDKCIEMSFLTPFNFEVLSQQRKRTYHNLNEDVTQEEIIDECERFLNYSREIIKHSSLSHSVFGSTLRLITQTYRPAEAFINDETKNIIINSEISTLKSILTELKKTPHKAGYRIKVTKTEINSLINLQKELNEDKLPNE